MDDEIEELSKEHPPEEPPTNEEKFQVFLEETKSKFDEYFGHLGYITFVFNKEKHKGESVYITNSPNDVLPIVEPFANVKEVAKAKGKKSFLRKMRRIK